MMLKCDFLRFTSPSALRRCHTCLELITILVIPAACAGTEQKIRDRVLFPGASPGLQTWTR